MFTDYERGDVQQRLRDFGDEIRGALARLVAPSNNAARQTRRVESAKRARVDVWTAVKCAGTYSPAAWSSDSVPQVNGATRVYSSTCFRRMVVTATLTGEFVARARREERCSKCLRRRGACGRCVDKAERSTREAHVVIDGLDDVVLVSAFAGASNCFPNAPHLDCGVPGRALAENSLAGEVDWPTVQTGCDISVAFTVKRTALARLASPTGFDRSNLERVHIDARLSLFGVSVDARG